MGNRLSKIYTRTGDDGTTGLADGSRIPKNALRVEAMGTADELNSHIGMLIELLPAGDSTRPLLQRIQHHLFDLGGEYAIPGSSLIVQAHIDWLEQELDKLNEQLPPLKNFILPGGSRPAAQAHLARSVCRRAERIVVGMSTGAVEPDNEERLNPLSQKYLNRLSDFLFVLARTLARRDGAQEILWDQKLGKF